MLAGVRRAQEEVHPSAPRRMFYSAPEKYPGNQSNGATRVLTMVILTTRQLSNTPVEGRGAARLLSGRLEEPQLVHRDECGN